MLGKHFRGNAGANHPMLFFPSLQLALIFLELKQKITLKAQKVIIIHDMPSHSYK